MVVVRLRPTPLTPGLGPPNTALEDRSEVLSYGPRVSALGAVADRDVPIRLRLLWSFLLQALHQELQILAAEESKETFDQVVLVHGPMGKPPP